MSPTSATRHLHRETLTPSAITDEEIRSLARFLQHTPSGSPVEPAYLCSPGGERVSIPARLYPLMETLLEALYREIAEETTRAEGKPEKAIPKIVEGRLNGFFKDVALLDQPAVADAVPK